MVVKAGTVTVGTTPTVLTTGSQSIVSSAVSVPADGQTVYIGGSDVTKTTGLPLTPGTMFAPDLGASDKLYAVVATGSQVVNVLTTGA